jgi:Tol biopolymer transport system component
MRRSLVARPGALLLPALALSLLAVPASAQFFPYYGKNKVTYDNFTWRVYKTPHFEIYYYPEFEQHLARASSYLESAYQKVSSTLKHEIGQPIPVILYKTHSEFEQTNLGGGFIPEGVQAFAEPVRGRMVMPIDEPPDKLQGLITHELTHIFEFDIIPRSLVQRNVPLWIDEGLADYMRGTWDPLDLMSLRDAAITDQIPKLSRFNVDYGGVSNPRLIYNMGHAAFEFIEARYGKEGIRQFLYTFRKNIVAGGMEDIYQQAFRTRPEEFDESFDKWLKERFKPFRDKQRPSDYGQDLAPDSEKTPFTQVFAFSPSPSGEVIAAVTGNRAEGEADVILLSANDGTVIRNLTKGFTDKFENLTFNDDFVAGRTISFDPRGDTIAFFARKGKKRSLYLASALDGDILKRIPIKEDQAQAPCLLPDGRRALYAAIKDGVADIFIVDLESGESKNLTDDAFHDNDPQVSADGKLVVYIRRISGHTKVMLMALDDPSRKTQLTFGAHSDAAPTFSTDGNLVYFSSMEDDDIPNVRSLDLRTGAIRQYTDALGGNVAPAVLRGKGGERVAFISYFKGEYRLQTIETTEPLKEVEQEVKTASAEETIDFQPDVTHEVVPENKRKKRTFEKLFLEGRPPLNVGVTSSGDFFGGSQIALTDVLGDHTFVATALSVQEFRSYEGTYFNLSRRFHYGVSAFDYTSFFYAAPYGLQTSFFREGAIATRRYTGASLLGQYPLDKFHRVEFSAGIVNQTEQFENIEAEIIARAQAEALGVPFALNSGKLAPISIALTGETTRFREFGPLSGHTYSVGFEVAPGMSSFLSRRSVHADVRKYFKIGQGTVFALRGRGFLSNGENPDIFFFGGNMELRGYPYLSIVGNRGFFANAELRIPIIDVMKTPLGILGPVRGTLFAGVGSAHFQGEDYTFGTSEPGVSFVNDDVFGEAVGGYHLVDGRASFGVGLQFFFLGYPLHFDWVKLTDFRVHSPWRFAFWIGYDF